MSDDEDDVQVRACTHGFPHSTTTELYCPACEINRLYAKVEQLKKDSLRLDWLEQKCSGASDSERYIPFRIYWGGGSHGDIRRAIDEAMEGDQE